MIAVTLVFDGMPLRFAAHLAWAEMAFGAAVPLGGAGSIGIGAWLLTERGAPAGRVAQRSAVLFLLTSGVNVIVLIVSASAWASESFTDRPAHYSKDALHRRDLRESCESMAALDGSLVYYNHHRRRSAVGHSIRSLEYSSEPTFFGTYT